MILIKQGLNRKKSSEHSQQFTLFSNDSLKPQPSLSGTHPRNVPLNTCHARADFASRLSTMYACSPYT